jgi:hypothetical protein
MRYLFLPQPAFSSFLTGLESLKGPWPPHTREVRHLEGLFWTSDEPVVKVSVYTAQDNIKQKDEDKYT